MPQHLAGVRATAEICGARVEGAAAGSMEILFEPGGLKPGTYAFNIGTAGAATLLLQSLIPPLVFAALPSNVVLTGGTHVPMSPCFDYVHNVFLPMLKAIGVSAEASIGHFGFYPKGGGKILAQIHPKQTCDPLQGIDLTQPPTIRSISGISGVANLPLSVAERQKAAAARLLKSTGLVPSIRVASVPAFGPGTFIFLKPEGDNCVAGFSSLGDRGKRAEQVGEEAAQALIVYLQTRMCVDHNLADQIALYLSMARGVSRFTTSSVTQHLLTNLSVIQRFLPISYSVEGQLDRPGKIVINGPGAPR